MEEVPNPLRISAPAGVSPSMTMSLLPHHRASRDRLSQLFPARPTSMVQATTADTPTTPRGSRGLSFPAPLLPAAEPAYKVPRAPAPPSFPPLGSTAYSPHHESAQREPQRPGQQPPIPARGFLSRITSLRTGSQARYGRLDDSPDAEPGHRRGRSGGTHHLGHVREEDESAGIVCGISAFEGPIALRSMHASTKSGNVTVEDMDPTTAGYAAEFHRLEAAGAKSEFLGEGMRSVIEAPSLYSAAQPQGSPRRRGPPSSVPPARKNAQMEAEKTGEILVVTEVPVDISNLGGGSYDTSSPLTASAGGSGGDSKQSYYFPEDPEQPSWRPLSMHWGYISILIVIAVGLAALQEYLCQLSIKRAKEGGGLLRFKAPIELSVAQYFSWKYAPTLILVSYGILWQISDFEVKRLEPYYQLSQRTGATAAESINNDYLTFLSYLIPLKAAKYRQWAVALSSISYLIAGSLVPVLQSASVKMYPVKALRKPEDWKYVRIDTLWSRLVSGALLLVAVLGCLLIFQLRRKSGLLSDPKGIAGIAAMATRSHILNDFRNLDIAPQHLIHKQLRHRRYILHKSSLWQGEYIRNSTEEFREHTDPRSLMLTKRAGVVYMAFILAVTAVIPIFMFVDQANKVTERLPWLLTALATTVKLLWGTLDCDIRLTEPFYILSRRHAPPSTLTLDYTGTIPGYLSVKALLNRHYIVALVGFGAIMTEVLTVCASSFSVDGKKFFPGQGHPGGSASADDRYNTDETFKSFWVSFALVIIILISLMLIAGFIYYRRSHKFMPRKPGTIASVLAYIHQSNMLLTFVGTERMDSKQMTCYLENMGKTYGLGWFTGRDGLDHCGIDEEPLHAGYKWGVDWRDGRMETVTTWERYE